MYGGEVEGPSLDAAPATCCRGGQNLAYARAFAFLGSVLFAWATELWARLLRLAVRSWCLRALGTERVKDNPMREIARERGRRNLLSGRAEPGAGAGVCFPGVGALPYSRPMPRDLQWP